MVIGSLVTNIVADLSKWGPNLAKGRGQLASFVKSVNVLKASIGGIVAVSGAAWLKQTADQASALKDQAANLNLTIEGMQRLRFASSQMGGNWNALSSSLTIYNKLVGDAVRGNKSAVNTFRSLGLEAKELADLGTQGGFLKVVDMIRALPQSQQTSVARELFGRSGAANLDFFRNGSAGIQGGMAGLSSLEVVSAETARRLDELADKAERLHMAWETTKINLAAFAVDMWDRTMSGGHPQRPTLSNWLGLKSDPSNISSTPLPPMFPRFPAMQFDSLPARQPGFPAMTGPRPRIWGSAPDIAVQSNLRDATRGMTQVMNMLPARMQLAIHNAMGTTPSLGPFGPWASRAGGMLAGAGGLGGLLGRAFASPFGTGATRSMGPLEALRGGTREAFTASRENLRPRADSAAERQARNSDKQTTLQQSIDKGIGKMADALTKGVAIIGGSIGG